MAYGSNTYYGIQSAGAMMSGMMAAYNKNVERLANIKMYEKREARFDRQLDMQQSKLQFGNALAFQEQYTKGLAAADELRRQRSQYDPENIGDRPAIVQIDKTLALYDRQNQNMQGMITSSADMFPPGFSLGAINNPSNSNVPVQQQTKVDPVSVPNPSPNDVVEGPPAAAAQTTGPKLTAIGKPQVDSINDIEQEVDENRNIKMAQKSVEDLASYEHTFDVDLGDGQRQGTVMSQTPLGRKGYMVTEKIDGGYPVGTWLDPKTKQPMSAEELSPAAVSVSDFRAKHGDVVKSIVQKISREAHKYEDKKGTRETLPDRVDMIIAELNENLDDVFRSEGGIHPTIAGAVLKDVVEAMARYDLKPETSKAIVDEVLNKLSVQGVKTNWKARVSDLVDAHMGKSGVLAKIESFLTPGQAVSRSAVRSATEATDSLFDMVVSTRENQEMANDAYRAIANPTTKDDQIIRQSFIDDKFAGNEAAFNELFDTGAEDAAALSAVRVWYQQHLYDEIEEKVQAHIANYRLSTAEELGRTAGREIFGIGAPKKIAPPGSEFDIVEPSSLPYDAMDNLPEGYFDNLPGPEEPRIREFKSKKDQPWYKKYLNL